ncbi:conserved protein of unknown function [Petrocella atlantisensis]|uniref:DUF3795 domain-containing protein n=1 Tax=Petrocella atlantisensis TaxID=2173034 RepID=A0A3P7PYY6_9FIRM|nr:DUF3795 domain-containing protein [Petrocella atlantisensis]VDN48361.1 conserved protein of unknown function [Petrocella atlantisensis]
MNSRIVAPCGIDCFNCELYESNVTEVLRERISTNLKIPKALVTCKGCHDGNQCLFLDLQGKTCETLACANDKGVDYCFECDTFPCKLLMPLANGADRFPQNMKVYNLCIMKRIGVEAWADEALDIRKIYFGKELEIGKGGC